MATIDINELDKYAFDFEELTEIPDDVIEAMLKAEGDIIRRGQSSTAAVMLQGPYNRHGIENAAKVGKVKKVKDGKAVYVTFEGKQHGTRLAEIAFINEYGKHNQSPRQFIRIANEKHADEAVDAAEKIYNDYLSKKGF